MQVQKLISLPPLMVDNFYELEGKDPGEWFCDSDPVGRKVGSGGGTASILASAWKNSGCSHPFQDWLYEGKRMIIHAGGDSRRLPAYSYTGKSLLPMPVFRWSRGQNMDQKLLDFQAAYYNEILQKAPASMHVLIGSGDVMFISTDRFHDLPEADVLVFGMWVDDEVATRHGVFFSHRDSPGNLAFAKQKPGLKDLHSLSRSYYYLMDSGIVLLSAKATMVLMERVGWNKESQEFHGGEPAFYDLYSQMLTSFGEESGENDPELSELEVKLVPLHQGEFYHFGSNHDLLTSALKLQNRVSDQRLRLARESDHHPSIFQQNSVVGMAFEKDQHHIWIENSHIPESWRLHHHHIITGVPTNDMELELPPGICIDMVPVDHRYCLRIYGFSDSFRAASDGTRRWMEKDLDDWLDQRGLDATRMAMGREMDMLDLSLFPLVSREAAPRMISILLSGEEDPGLWVSADRISSRELAMKVDLPRLYSQRETYKGKSLSKLCRNPKSVFYYLDLEKTSNDFRNNKLSLPEELNKEEGIIKRISDSMFRSSVLLEKDHDGKYGKRAFSILRKAMMETLQSDPLYPKKNVLDDQILWGRSPVRLDLAGGWTDTPPYCIMEGGKVVNLAVELNGQLPLQVYMRPLEESKIVLRSIDLGLKEEISTFDQLERYDQIGGAFTIPKAALVLAGFGRQYSAKTYPSLEAQLVDLGCGIEISLLAAIPKGSGLGTSSNLAATVLGTISTFCGLNWDRHEVAYRTLILEQMLTTGGGWQDQYGGIFEGIKLLETVPGLQQRPSIKWLPDFLFDQGESKSLMMLYYTGVTRVAKGILGEIVKGMFLNSSRHLEIFTEMQSHAKETFETILHNDYEGLAEKIALSWELNQRLDQGTNPPEIRGILTKVEDFLLAYKLLGAGGGGYLLMFAKTADAAIRTRQILEQNPPNSRARFVEFRVSKTGFQVSSS